MGKQSQAKFKKRQREFERKRKAKEKMDRRQGKISSVEAAMEASNLPDEPNEPEQTET